MDANAKCDVCQSEITADYLVDSTTNTYIIYNAKGLYAWAEIDTPWGEKNPTVILGNDIVMPAELTFDLDNDGTTDSNWQPFYLFGNFDGNGHSIENLIVVSNSSEIGLFNKIALDSFVKNLNLKNVKIKGEMWVGGISGSNLGTISNCSVSGIIEAELMAGGIVGQNDQSVIACHNMANVKGQNKLGGICGVNNQNLVACYNSGKITTLGDSYGSLYGGIAGQSNTEGNVIACYQVGGFVLENTGDSSKVGAVVGDNSSNTKANYYKTDLNGEPLVGEGFADNGEPSVYVDGTKVTWLAAMENMNQAIEEWNNRNIYLCEYRYQANEGEETPTIPLKLILSN